MFTTNSTKPVRWHVEGICSTVRTYSALGYQSQHNFNKSLNLKLRTLFAGNFTLYPVGCSGDHKCREVSGCSGTLTELPLDV